MGIQELLSLPAVILGAAAGPLALFALFRLIIAVVAEIFAVIVRRSLLQPLLIQSKTHFFHVVGMLVPFPLMLCSSYSNLLMKKQLDIAPWFKIPLPFRHRLWIECLILIIPITLMSHYVVGLVRRRALKELIIDLLLMGGALWSFLEIISWDR